MANEDKIPRGGVKLLMKTGAKNAAQPASDPTWTATLASRAGGSPFEPVMTP